ncbi:MAG: ROK family protein [Acidobacteriota bacterium]|nr:ROK family protein [Acidobacteriota bacterium]
MARDRTLVEVFRRWIMAQVVAGYQTAETHDGHVRLEGEAHVGEVNFYDLGGGSPEVVEMRITRRSDDQHVFFLHFMMDDLMRAQELFGEMADALHERASDHRTRVLLSCTCGITTTMFASKMGELSETLGLGYEVQAKPLDGALRASDAFDVVMLAPQVAHERNRMAEAHPHAVVFEIPARIFGSYDAAGAVRLLANALDGHNRAEGGSADPTELPSDLVWPGRIMVVAAVLGARQSSFEYRVFDNGETVLQGRSTKRSFDFRDIEDLLAGVRLQGVDVGRLDAIGIAVPGIIDEDAVSLLMSGVFDYDLGGHVQQAYGVPVFLDNDANAAAVGCYSTQRRYGSISYHRESFGHGGGGQGVVIDGRLHRGRKNFVGELNHLTDVIKVSGRPADLAWTEDGMYELVSRWVLINVVQNAPDAIYVDAWPVTDMERLRGELTPFVDERYLPDLLPAPDFTECTLLGELALCIQRLQRRNQGSSPGSRGTVPGLA